MSLYWHVNDLRKFNNIMIHQMAGDIKYLCCLSCQSSIVGYQIISQPHLIFVSCDRVKLENEINHEMNQKGGRMQEDDGQY